MDICQLLHLVLDLEESIAIIQQSVNLHGRMNATTFTTANSGTSLSSFFTGISSWQQFLLFPEEILIGYLML